MRRLLPLLALLGLVLAACGSPSDAGPAEAVWQGTGDRIDVRVGGLHCAGCEKSVEDEIKKLDGVLAVTADRTSTVVSVRIADPARRDVLIPEIRKAVKAVDKTIVGE
jgi:copper chaperone CopZ